MIHPRTVHRHSMLFALLALSTSSSSFLCQSFQLDSVAFVVSSSTSKRSTATLLHAKTEENKDARPKPPKSLASRLGELLDLITKEEQEGKGIKKQAEEDDMKSLRLQANDLDEFKKDGKNEFGPLFSFVVDEKQKQQAEQEASSAIEANVEEAVAVASPASTELTQAPAPASPGTTEELPSFIGRTVLDGQYTVAEKFRIGSMKCEIFVAHHTDDKDKQRPVAIKLTNGYPDHINIEYKVYSDIFNRLGKDVASKYFIKTYDWIPESPETDSRCGFLMDCGYENLRSFMFRNGSFPNKKLLKNAMQHVISIVAALHRENLVWTEVKAENFIVMFPTDGSKNEDRLKGIDHTNIHTMIKGADLESMCGHQDTVRVYSAEVYPPEFPVDDLYNGPCPKIPLEYSFDLWGLGMVLFEMVTGQPLLTLQKTYDVEYIKTRLRDPQNLVDEVHKKLDELTDVDEGAKNIVKQCLIVDPTRRASCEDLLKDAYFRS